MARKYNIELRKKRDVKLKKRYDELCNYKKDGVHFYSESYIMMRLELEFFLLSGTIYKIIKKNN
jgi:hypothetical protein